jgi:hypothetical protein
MVSMHRSSFKEDYKFSVEKREGYNDQEGVFGYSVNLPHQCDDWEILGAEVEDDEKIEALREYPDYPLSKELAISQMELFIKRANEALEKLKQL